VLFRIERWREVEESAGIDWMTEIRELMLWKRDITRNMVF
jgi:hypothetical protein